MPQSSDYLQGKMREYFGDPIGDAGPTKFLKEQGYSQTAAWTWIKPNPRHEITAKEEECIVFLVTEWDWGGLDINQEFEE